MVHFNAVTYFFYQDSSIYDFNHILFLYNVRNYYFTLHAEVATTQRNGVDLHIYYLHLLQNSMMISSNLMLGPGSSQLHWGETWCANVHVRASKMEDGKCGAQTRRHFSYFNTDFRLETDVQGSSCLEWLYAISNLTGSVLYCCWAACESWRKMRERTWYDALTYIASKQRMRERILRCANERFPAPTNEHRLLASLR